MTPNVSIQQPYKFCNLGHPYSWSVEQNYTNLWNIQGTYKKSIYDPCPVGYKVPSTAYNSFSVSMRSEVTEDFVTYHVYNYQGRIFKFLDADYNTSRVSYSAGVNPPRQQIMVHTPTLYGDIRAGSTGYPRYVKLELDN